MDTPPLPAGVSVVAAEGGLPAVHIDTAACAGTVYFHGAHVSAWAPTGHRPVLWMSESSVFEHGRAIRGGVPICAPWFGAGRDGDRAPAHGFFRLAPWRLIEATVLGDAIVLTLELTDADCIGVQGADGYPPFRARYRVSMGATLDLALSITAVSEPLVVEEALHTYFAVAGIDEVRVAGLDGAGFVDKAPGASPQNCQLGDVVFTSETDRVYRSTATVSVIDPEMQRIITVTKEGSAHTVVWNPWRDKAAAMPDFGDHEWPGMLCIESANVLDASLRIPPGESHLMRATIAVE